ncbi:hypothetical protein HHL17_12570 [Chitinophaga sp. G-6-1-13]|uniref:Uncharacterized protein n=1 Tax=Chitinophaga fulva TaxID=2728842 RepID=A0A848GMX7_9BACT|nr:hypothetical protein [Chitinophaga fulva]NML38030.1 hypothetical protein [Chitinophaga fulva]
MFSFFACGQQPGSALPPLARYDSLGTGILQVSFDEKIPLYANAGDKTPFDTLVIRQKKDGSYAFLTQVLKTRFTPYRLFEGDTYEAGSQHINMGLVHFPAELQLRVVEATKTYFRVVINEKEKLTCFIRIQSDYALYSTMVQKDLHNSMPYNGKKTTYNPNWYLYETWENLLQRACIVHVKPDTPLFESPQGKRIPFPKREDNCDDCFKVGEVRGEWAQLIDREDYNRKKKTYGWVKWHNGTTMTVTYVEFLYE